MPYAIDADAEMPMLIADDTPETYATHDTLITIRVAAITPATLTRYAIISYATLRRCHFSLR